MCMCSVFSVHTRTFEPAKQEHLPVLISFGFWQVAVCQFCSRINTSDNTVAAQWQIFIIFCFCVSIEHTHEKRRKNEIINKTYRRLMSYINCRILLSFIKCEDEDLKTRNKLHETKQRSKRTEWRKIFFQEECWIEASKVAVLIGKRNTRLWFVRLCGSFSLLFAQLSQQIYHCHSSNAFNTL